MRYWFLWLKENFRVMWEWRHWSLVRRLILPGLVEGSAVGPSAYALNRLMGFWGDWELRWF